VNQPVPGTLPAVHRFPATASIAANADSTPAGTVAVASLTPTNVNTVTIAAVPVAEAAVDPHSNASERKLVGMLQNVLLWWYLLLLFLMILYLTYRYRRWLNRRQPS